MSTMTDAAYQQCMMPTCGATYGVDEILFACRKCGALLDVRYDWSHCPLPRSLSEFDSRRGSAGRTSVKKADASGVWRFRELLPFADVEELVTIGEGRTILQPADRLAKSMGAKHGKLFLQYEGFNPSGSFKDNGMAAAFTIARKLGRRRVACASTGNTSASMAMFAAQTATRSDEPMQAIVFVGGDKIALGKLSQALDFGARTLQIAGDFDACMRLVQESADRLDLYLMNSVNPFRLEGQKTIMYRVLAGLSWDVPDWVIVPGGNLGNTSAFGKAFVELRELGLIQKVPRLAVINAAGANTLCELYNDLAVRFDDGAFNKEKVDAYYERMTADGRRAQTVASAIEIGRPVNLTKALRSLEAMDGVVRQVPDEDILDHKALVGSCGLGCEPASAASVAGLRVLLGEQVISPSDRVVCILTGHGLKDPTATIKYHSAGPAGAPGRRHANPPIQADAEIDAVAAVLDEHTTKKG